MLKREQESLHDEHLDDDYWYNKYLEEKQYEELKMSLNVQESVQDSVQNQSINTKE